MHPFFYSTVLILFLHSFSYGGSSCDTVFHQFHIGKKREVSATSYLVSESLRGNEYYRKHGSVEAKSFIQEVNKMTSPEVKKESLEVGKGLESFWKEVSSYLIYRKQTFNTEVTRFLEKYPNGQVVVLAAGVDPLSQNHIQRFKKAKFFDLDYENTDLRTDINKKIFSKKYSDWSKFPIRTQYIDLSNPQNLITTLKSEGWRRDLPTMITAEGITMYISKESFFKSLEKVAFDMKGLTEFRVLLDYWYEPNGDIHKGAIRNTVMEPRKVQLVFQNIDKLFKDLLGESFSYTLYSQRDLESAFKTLTKNVKSNSIKNIDKENSRSTKKSVKSDPQSTKNIQDNIKSKIDIVFAKDVASKNGKSQETKGDYTNAIQLLRFQLTK